MKTSSNSTNSFKKLPGVFALRKSLVISDAVMRNIDADGIETPVSIVRHGISGTQNLAPNVPKAYKEVSNIQLTESAKLDPSASGLSVTFSLKMTPLALALHSCSGVDGAAVRKSVTGFIERAVVSEGAMEVCLRYARNIANGKWLWRNKEIASDITITVNTVGGETIASFDAKRIPSHKFENYSKEERLVADVLMSNLTGETHLGLVIKATIQLGVEGSVEVFPSQNYVEKKPSGFSRSLYKINPKKIDREDVGPAIVGDAAIRDQKIGNALRTFDTWYSEFNFTGLSIPVEPNGASLEFDSFFRKTKNGSLFDSLKNLNNLDENSDEGKFVIACMIRGGVFGESDKNEEPKGDNNASEETLSAVAATGE